MRLRDKWAELLILIIMVPALTWLLKIASDLEIRTAALEKQVANFVKTSAEIRLGITAAALVNQPFRSAIVTFKPVQEETEWTIYVEIFNTVEETFGTYTAKLDTRRKKLLDVSLISSIKRTDLDALNFREMQEMARIVGLSERSLPQNISQEDSFVINSDPREVEKELKSFGFDMITVRPAKGVQTYPALIEMLTQRHSGR